MGLACVKYITNDDFAARYEALFDASDSWGDADGITPLRLAGGGISLGVWIAH